MTNAYEEFVKRMNDFAEMNDTEMAHLGADSLLIDFLLTNGYSELCDAYSKVEKWFS